MGRHIKRMVILLAPFLMIATEALAQRPTPEERQPVPVEPSQARAEQIQAEAERTPAAPVDPKTYLIGAEDRLLMRVWREPEVSGAVIVRPDGMITMPLIGDVRAGGLTPEQLSQRVTEELSKFLNRPEVMVSVISVQSKKYYITGEVVRTGAFPLVVPTTVLEALSGAGGFREWADQKNIIILRGDKRLKFNYKDIIKGKNLSQNVYLENGDHIIVP